MKMIIELDEFELRMSIREYLEKRGHISGDKVVAISFKEVGQVGASVSITEDSRPLVGWRD